MASLNRASSAMTIPTQAIDIISARKRSVSTPTSFEVTQIERLSSPVEKARRASQLLKSVEDEGGLGTSYETHRDYQDLTGQLKGMIKQLTDENVCSEIEELLKQGVSEKKVKQACRIYDFAVKTLPSFEVESTEVGTFAYKAWEMINTAYAQLNESDF